MKTEPPSPTGRSFTVVTLAALLSRTGWKSLCRLRDLLVCELIGHAIDWCDPWNTRCFRCGLTWNYGDRVRDDLWFFLGICNLRYHGKFYQLQHWLKCPDCGRRLGRHDPGGCFPF